MEFATNNNQVYKSLGNFLFLQVENVPVKKSKLALVVSMAVGMGVSGCSSMKEDTSSQSTVEASSSSSSQLEIDRKQAQLEAREAELKAREMQLSEQAALLAKQGSANTSAAASAGSADGLLPPNAKSGECYARLWVEPKYKTVEKTVVVQEASERVEVIPAKYEMVAEQVLVQEAGTRIEEIPAKYGSEKKRILVSEAQRSWKTAMKKGRPVGDALVAAARSGGADVDGAAPGSCFREYFKAPQYEQYKEQVLVSEASSRIQTSPAKYEMVTEQKLIAEGGQRVIEVPAVYETITERVIDKPAHTVWKKGTGPIQRIDSATGEIMCLVEVPATYKTIKRRVVKTPATTRVEEIPAKYETVKVRKMVAAPQQSSIDVPAEYQTVTKSKLVAPGEYMWRPYSDRSLEKARGVSRTGQKLCLTEVPARYKTKTVRTVLEPASVREIPVPARYDTVKVRKIVQPAQERRVPIPEVTKVVTSQELVSDGFMEWRTILCETNMNRNVGAAIQRALKKEGYNVGTIDGVIGKQTMRAVNDFQRKNKLPVDRYLNMQTIKALGVSI